MSRKENGNKFGTMDIWMLLITMIWGVNLSMIKFSLREFTPHGFNGIRFGLSSLVYLAILLFSGEGFRLSKGDFWKVVGLGLLGTTIYQLLFIQGINGTSASTTSMMMPLTPVFIALLSHFFGFERIHWAAWLGIAVSFLGVYLIVTGEKGGFILSWQSIKGDVLILAANLVWACYTVFSKPLLKRISPIKLAALTTALGTLFYMPLAAGDVLNVPWRSITVGAWASLFYSGILGIVFCFVIWYKAVQKIGSTKTGIYSNLNPVFATIFACFFLSERITVLWIGGALIIFFGVYMTRSGYRYLQRGDRSLSLDTSREK